VEVGQMRLQSEAYARFSYISQPGRRISEIKPRNKE
jgi:hypothetical protein